MRRTSTSWSSSSSRRAGTSAGSATRPAARAARRLTPRSGSRRSRSSSPAPDERVSSIARRLASFSMRGGGGGGAGGFFAARAAGAAHARTRAVSVPPRQKPSHHPPIIASAAGPPVASERSHAPRRHALSAAVGDGDEVDAVREAQAGGLRADPLPGALLPDRGQVQRPAQAPRLRDRDDRNAVPTPPHLARVHLDERAHLVTRGAQRARPGPADRPRPPDDDPPAAGEGAPGERLELQREEAPGRVARVRAGEAARRVAPLDERLFELGEAQPRVEAAQPQVVVLGAVEVPPAAEPPQRGRPHGHRGVDEGRLDESVARHRVVVDERVLPLHVGAHALPGGDARRGGEGDAAAEDVDRGVLLEPLRLEGEARRPCHVVRVHPRHQGGAGLARARGRGRPRGRDAGCARPAGAGPRRRGRGGARRCRPPSRRPPRRPRDRRASARRASRDRREASPPRRGPGAEPRRGARDQPWRRTNSRAVSRATRADSPCTT